MIAQPEEAVDEDLIDRERDFSKAIVADALYAVGLFALPFFAL